MKWGFRLGTNMGEVDLRFQFKQVEEYASDKYSISVYPSCCPPYQQIEAYKDYWLVLYVPYIQNLLSGDLGW